MQQGIPLSDALEFFLLDIQSRRFTAHTLRFYRGRLSLFVEWCNEQGINHLEEVGASHIRKYLASIQQRGLSSAYQHGFARAIRAWLNFCVRDELIESSPFDKVKMPRLEKKILPALTSAEIKTVLQTCSTDRDKAICLFLLDSGVRASEIIALNAGDVNMETGVVNVRQGKGQKDRVTYIGARTRKQLMRYFVKERSGQPESTEPVFISQRGGTRLTYYGLAQLMKRLRKDSGVDECKAHAFRRTFAINCLRNGMNIYVLQRLMGHADLTVLKQYLALVEDDLKDAHDKHGVVDNLL